MLMLSLILFFFFKQKTAYEMRISDWSSDVCSSDLDAHRFGTGALPVQLAENALDVAKRVAPVIVGPIAAAVVQRALDDETATDLETVMRAETPVKGRKAVCDAGQLAVEAVLPVVDEGGGAFLAGEGGWLAGAGSRGQRVEKEGG